MKDQNDSQVKEWLNSLDPLRNTFLDLSVNGGIALGIVIGAMFGMYIYGSHGMFFGILAGVLVFAGITGSSIGIGFYFSDKWFLAWRKKKYGY